MLCPKCKKPMILFYKQKDFFITEEEYLCIDCMVEEKEGDKE